MRIGLVVPPWQPVPPLAYGAIEAQVHDLAVAFDARGHDVLLATTGDSTCPVERVVTYERSRPDAAGRGSVELVHVLEAYDAMGDADVVHDHTIVGPAVGPQLCAGPVVTTVHWTLTRHIRRLYARIGLTVPLVAVSHAQARAAPEVPIARVIHHGIDTSRIRVGSGAGGYLLVLSRMDADKGVDLAIDAARRAGERLVIAGPVRTAREQAYFDEHVRPRLGGDVEYVGEVGGGDKQALLGAARAVLMPVRWEEPFGMVAVEALAAGTPVLAFARGALPEIVDDGRTGFLCRDVAELATAIGRLEVLDRGACRASAVSRFSADRMADEHLALYEELVRGRG